uniref:Uncharacterized protein n=1 Tax=Micrurus spixii TaxID=129469 RepID=A0A2D4LM34_9SAUR
MQQLTGFRHFHNLASWVELFYLITSYCQFFGWCWPEVMTITPPQLSYDQNLVLSNQLTFITVAVSCSHVNIICDHLTSNKQKYCKMQIRNTRQNKQEKGKRTLICSR